MSTAWPPELHRWLITGELPVPLSADMAAALVAAAHEQRLAPLLDSAVSRRRGSWPERLASELRRAHEASLYRGVQQLAVLARAQGILLQAGSRSVPLKGGALAERVYDSIADRPMSDVDLLILNEGADEGEWDASVGALVRDGFRIAERADHAWALQDPDTGVVLELHHSVTSCPGLFPLDRDGVWRRSEPGAGQVPRVPSVEDVIVHLALHTAFQHGLVLTMVQHLDIRRLFERGRPDPERLLELAADAGAEIPLILTLKAAQTVAGLALPEVLGRLVEARMPRAPSWLRRRLLDPHALVPPALSPLLRLRWHLGRHRRRALISGTLGLRKAKARESSWHRTARVVRRIAGLVRVHAWPAKAPRPAHGKAIVTGEMGHAAGKETGV